MKKRILALLVVCALTVTAFAACAIKPAEENKPDVTNVPATDAATEAPVVTEAPNPTDPPAPTEAPTEAPTKEPKPTMDLNGLDAILVDFEEDLITGSACTFEMDDVWLNITTDIGDNNITFSFPENFKAEEYPFIAFKYRLEFAQSIRNTNHFYSITTEAGGPSPTEGMWSDITWISDLDWHTGILNLAEQFPAATGDWTAIRFPTVDTLEGVYALAWLGAFKSEEDIAKYDDIFNSVNGSKLVKAEEPAEEDKEEEFPDVDDAFDETVLDFEDFDDGQGMTPGQHDYFDFTTGANQSSFVEMDGNIVGKLAFDALWYAGMVKSGTAYSVKFDLKNGGNQANFGGFVFNWGDERNISRNFFENNGLEGDGMGSLVSASGCGVFFLGGNKFKIYVPTWDLENNKKSYISATIESEVDFSAAFVHFEVADNGTDTVTIKANDVVIAVVKYSNPGVINKAVGYNEGYYRTVAITDATGTELASVENGALFSIYKSFAWAGRAHDVFVDNIQFTNVK
ncbi:MAG: hypothetical protein IKH41_00175 [Clostridia bacterium]|nr:hypothetical protein [Clostridia bacterium]